MPARETARLAYRRRVAEAAREWQPWAWQWRSPDGGRIVKARDIELGKMLANKAGMFVPPLRIVAAFEKLQATLSAPKPWLGERGQRVQPKRATRGHRRSCGRWKCPCNFEYHADMATTRAMKEPRP